MAGKKAEKPKYNAVQNSWFMIKLAWTVGEKKVIVLCLLSALVNVATSLIYLYLSPTILSAVERHVPAGELILTIVGFTAAHMLLLATASYIASNTLYGRIAVRSELITLLNLKAATTSYPNMYDDKFGKLLNKAGEHCGNNRASTEAIWGTLTNLLKNLLGFGIYVGLIFSVEPVLIPVILATTVAGFFLTRYLNGYEYRHREEQGRLSRHINYLSGRAGDKPTAKDIRIFGLGTWLTRLYDDAFAAADAFRAKAEGVYTWGKVVNLVLTFLRNGVAYAYLIGLVLGDGLSVAEFLLYFSAVGGFTDWVSGILGNLGTLHRQSLDISVVRECLEYPEPFLFEGGAPIAPQAGKMYEIRLENVSFRYPGADKNILTEVNLTLHPGEKLAVVGLNGAGKTTLVRLICGFLDPTEGRVLLDGRDIRELDRTQYYTMFSAVFQQFSLLAATVAANVAQSETEIDMDRVRACVAQADLTDKIASLPNGYETYMNREVYEDAVLFSGGETQRLMLARALYKNAPIIILDEPTAALDPIAESQMYQKYHEMTAGKSSIYISHRLASTRFCDRIVMIADGGLCEEGTHEELLQRGGKYAELYEVQSRYYREEASEDEEK